MNDAWMRMIAWDLGHEFQRDDWTTLSCIYCGLSTTIDDAGAKVVKETGRCKGMAK